MDYYKLTGLAENKNGKRVRFEYIGTEKDSEVIKSKSLFAAFSLSLHNLTLVEVQDCSYVEKSEPGLHLPT